MRLLVIIGPPAVGTMTVGRELAARSDFRLFHKPRDDRAAAGGLRRRGAAVRAGAEVAHPGRGVTREGLPDLRGGGGPAGLALRWMALLVERSCAPKLLRQ